MPVFCPQATSFDEQILERLGALNQQRADEERREIIRWLRPELAKRFTGANKDRIAELSKPSPP